VSFITGSLMNSQRLANSFSYDIIERMKRYIKQILSTSGLGTETLLCYSFEGDRMKGRFENTISKDHLDLKTYRVD
jgi:hypothetical protein